jgi:hypothetical protein
MANLFPFSWTSVPQFGLVLGLALGLLSGCNYRELKGPALTLKSSGRVPSFAEVKAQVFLPKCANCHGIRETHAHLDLTDYASTKRKINLSDPKRSKLWLAVTGELTDVPKMPMMDHPGMSPESGLTKEQMQLLFDWIMGGAPETSTSLSTGGNPGSDGGTTHPQARPTFTDLKAKVLTLKCLMCHSGPKPPHHVDLSTYEKLIASGVLEFNSDHQPDLESSDLWMQVADDDPMMPLVKQNLPDSSKWKALAPEETITKEQRDLVRAWIEAGANP